MAQYSPVHRAHLRGLMPRLGLGYTGHRHLPQAVWLTTDGDTYHVYEQEARYSLYYVGARPDPAIERR